VFLLLRLLHLADLHLGWIPDLPEPQRSEVRRERDGLLKAAVDLALDQRQGISLVVIAGDLFETHRPDPVLVEEVIRQLARLEAGGIPVITVPGNHDEITYHDSVYRREAKRWPGVLVTEPMPAQVATLTVGSDQVNVYALAYTGGVTRTNPPLADFPAAERGINLAVFHGSLDWEAGDRSLPLSGEGLARAGYDYVALGHIHQPAEKTLGKGLAVYAGAVAGRGFFDPGMGKWTIVTLGQGKPQLERIQAPVRPWRVENLDLSAFGNLEEVQSALLARGDAAALVQIRLTGTTSFPWSRPGLAARLSPHFYYLELLDETTGFDPSLLDEWGQEPTIRGLFIRRLQEQLREAKTKEETQLLQRALLRGVQALMATTAEQK